MSLEFVLFLFSCDAFRHSETYGQNFHPQRLVVLPAAGFSANASGASGSSQPQAVRTRDQVTPSASLLEANGSGGSDTALSRPQTVATGAHKQTAKAKNKIKTQTADTVDIWWNQKVNLILKESGFDQQAIQRDHEKMYKIINVCIKEIATSEEVCDIQDMERQLSLKQIVEHGMGRAVTGVIRTMRDVQTTLTNLFFADEESLSSFNVSWKVLQGFADLFAFDPSRRACLALCATKMVLKGQYTTQEVLPAKYGNAEVVWRTGFGTCHEYATLAVFLARKLGVEAWVDMEAGGEGNFRGNDDRLTDWEVESCRKVFAGRRHESVNAWDKCMVGCTAVQVFGACSAACFCAKEDVACAAALGTFLYYSAMHHYPAFAWESGEPPRRHTYHAEVYKTFIQKKKGENTCKFFKN